MPQEPCKTPLMNPRERIGQLSIAKAAPAGHSARNRNVQKGAITDKIGNEMAYRRLVKPLRRVDLRDPSSVDHRDAVRHRQRLALVVGDVDDRGAEALMQVHGAGKVEYIPADQARQQIWRDEARQ